MLTVGHGILTTIINYDIRKTTEAIEKGRISRKSAFKKFNLHSVLMY